MACVTPLRLAVALDGAGWHPAARLASDATLRDLGSDAHWTELLVEAEYGKLDFVTFEDSLAQIAARLAPLTSRIGLVPMVTSTNPEPSEISTAIATLDQVSSGRAGWQPRIDGTRETVQILDDVLLDGGTDVILDAATQVVTTVRRLWDEANPAQGQPVVVALAHSVLGYRFAACSADVILVTPTDENDARRIVAEVRAEESEAGRTSPPLRIFADLSVFLDDTESAAVARKARLDDLSGDEYFSDAAVFVGTPTQLMRRLQVWQRAGIEGFRLRPGELPHDLRAITRGLVPALQENDAFRRGYEARNLRALLGMPRPVNRYSATT